MTNTNTPTGTDGSGKGSILKDSKIAAVVTGAVAAAGLYVADWLGQLDITPLPDQLEPLVGGAILTAVAWLTAKFAPRR